MVFNSVTQLLYNKKLQSEIGLPNWHTKVIGRGFKGMKVAVQACNNFTVVFEQLLLFWYTF